MARRKKRRKKNIHKAKGFDGPFYSRVIEFIKAAKEYYTAPRKVDLKEKEKYETH